MKYFIILNKKELVGIRNTKEEAREKSLEVRKDMKVGVPYSIVTFNFEDQEVHLNFNDIGKYVYLVMEVTEDTEDILGVYDNEEDILPYKNNSHYEIKTWENYIDQYDYRHYYIK
jgi:hypothetical protein